MTTLDTTTPPPDVADLRRQLVERFAAFARRVRNHLVLEGAARVLAELVALALLSFVVDRVFRLGLGARLVFLVAAAGVLAWEAWRFVALPLRLPLGPLDLATAIDRRRGGPSDHAASAVPSLAARVASVLQLPDLIGGSAGGRTSEPMVRHAVARSYASIADVDFDAHLDRRRRQLAIGAIAAMILLPLLLAAMFPQTAGLWARRWLLGSSQPWPQRTYLSVAGLGDDRRILVPRGEPHVLRVGLAPGSEEPANVTVTTRAGRGRKETAAMTRFGPGDWRYELPPLQAPTDVYLEGGDDEPAPFRVEPVDRPRVGDLSLAAQHPTQASPEVRTLFAHDAEAAFLPKTRMALTIVATTPVSEVRLKGGAAGAAAVGAPRRLDDRRFALSWTHEAPVQLAVELVGTVGGLTSVPTPLSIGLKVDQPPRVTLQYTGVRQRVTPQAQVPLNVKRATTTASPASISPRASRRPIPPRTDRAATRRRRCSDR